MIANGVVLIDSDSKRRAEIAHILRGKDVHVEPYECVADFVRYPVKAAIYLIRDEGDVIQEMLDADGPLDHLPVVVAYSDEADAPRIVSAVKMGASNYIIWPFDETILELTIGPYAAKTSNIALIRSRVLRAKRTLKCLTERELEVLEHLARGLSSKEIAIELKISPRTVEIHRANMIVKTGAKNAYHLVRLAAESSLDEELQAPGLIAA